MLSALSVRNIVLIDRLDLDLETGLSVLSGETGAGKSILLDALALALGGRGNQALVQTGCDSGQVICRFVVPLDHVANQLLRESGLEVEQDLILRRVQYGDGRTRALVNDQAVSANLLRRIGAVLVEIHGQHDDRALVDPSTHRRLLDAFGAHADMVADVARTCAGLEQAQSELDRQTRIISAAVREREFALHAVAELEQMACKAAEEAELAARRQHLMELEKSADEVRDADEILCGPLAPGNAVATLLRRLQRRGENHGALFDPVVEGLDNSLEALELAVEALETIKQEMDFDPQELNRVEERLFALRALARKHNVTPDELEEVLGRYRGQLVALDDGEARLVRLQEALEEARGDYVEAAGRLSEARTLAGHELEAAVHAELPDLKLGAARFIVVHQIDADRVSTDGFDRIEFHVQTNPGTRSGPMQKIASGGELSRFLLALKVALADRGSAPVLIFDEIDTGVGGAVADAMGRRLQRLSEKVQVLSVTHAPQVAARATQHLLIEKQAVEKGARVRTRVRLLDDKGRAEEIARMLAGAKVSEEARAAAKRLISEVG